MLVESKKVYTIEVPIFQFKPFTKSDIPLLFNWLAYSHVARWWRETGDYKKLNAKYRNRICADGVAQFVIINRNKPIGYISWYKGTSESYPERTYGIDLFIADFEYVGKGYGHHLINQFIDHIIKPMHPKKIIVDPEISNSRAIRVYQKVGFKKTKIIQTSDGTRMVPAQLMELEIPDA